MTIVPVNLTTSSGPPAGWVGTIGAGSTVTLNTPDPVATDVVYTTNYMSVPTSPGLPGTFTLIGTVTLKTSYVYDAGYSNVDMSGSGTEYTGGLASTFSSVTVKQGMSIIAHYDSPPLPSHYWAGSGSAVLTSTVNLNIPNITDLSTLSITYQTGANVSEGTVSYWYNGNRGVTGSVGIGPVYAPVTVYDIYLTGTAIIPSFTSFVSNTYTAPKNTVVYLTAVFANGTAELTGVTSPYNLGIGTMTSGVPYPVTLPNAALNPMRYLVLVSDGVNHAYDQTKYLDIVVDATAALAGSLVCNKTIATQGTDIVLTPTFGAGLTATIDQGVGSVTSGVGKLVTLPNTPGNVTYTLTVDNGVGSLAVDARTVLCTAPSVNKYVAHTTKSPGGVGFANKIWNPLQWDEDISNSGHYPKDSIDPSSMPYNSFDVVSAGTNEFSYFAYASLLSGTAPVIISSPLSNSKQETQDASFTCSAVGSGPMTFTWYRNGSLYSTDSSPVFDGSSTYTSTVTKTGVTIATDNASTWYAIATNTAGNATSDTATLTVTALVGGPQVARIYSGGGTHTAAVDSTTTIHYYITSDRYNAITQSALLIAELNAMTIVWYENGSVISTGTARALYGWLWTDSIDASLTLSVPIGKNGNVYRIEVTNSAGTVVSADTTLNLLSAPYAPTTLSNATVNEGSNFTLGPVSASGPGPFTYKWYAVKMLDIMGMSNTVWDLSTDPVFTDASASTNTLTMPAKWAWPWYLWFGTGAMNSATMGYYCVVTNAAGWVSTNTATITVTPTASANPVLVTNPSNYSVSEGSDVTFTSAFSGTISGYHWAGNLDMWGGNYAIPSKTLTALTLAQSGTNYSCTAWNSHGSTASGFGTVTVLSGGGGGAGVAYRPTTGTGVTTYPLAVDTTAAVIDTTTFSSHSQASTGGIRTSNSTFSSFGTGIHNGTLNLKAIGYCTDDAGGSASSISIHYSYNGGAARVIEVIGSSYDGIQVDLTFTNPFTSPTLTGVDLGTLSVSVVLTGQRTGSSIDTYSWASSHIDLYDIVFITS